MTEGAEALLRKGKAAYIKESRRLGQQYTKAEAPRAGTGAVRVEVTGPQGLAEELASSTNPVLKRLAGITEKGKDYTVRDVREAQRILKDKAYTGDRARQGAYREALQQLDNQLDDWAEKGGEASQQQLKELRKIDRTFDKNIMPARREFGVKGAGARATFPKLESVVSALRNPKTSAAYGRRVVEQLPQATPELRSALGALAKEDMRVLRSDLAKDLLSADEKALVEQILKNLD